jgi:hypothetical protein
MTATSNEPCRRGISKAYQNTVLQRSNATVPYRRVVGRARVPSRASDVVGRRVRVMHRWVVRAAMRARMALAVARMSRMDAKKILLSLRHHDSIGPEARALIHRQRERHRSDTARSTTQHVCARRTRHPPPRSVFLPHHRNPPPTTASWHAPSRGMTAGAKKKAQATAYRRELELKGLLMPAIAGLAGAAQGGDLGEISATNCSALNRRRRSRSALH